LVVDRHKSAYRKWIASLLQTILKHQPTYRLIDTKKDYKAQYGVEVGYHAIWWGKELAQSEL